MAKWMRVWAALSVVAFAFSFGCGEKEEDPVDAGGTREGGGDGAGGDGGWQAAVGDNGVFVQTFDDRTWQSREVANVDLYSVACVGNVLAWTAGDAGTILHSNDSGQNWTKQASGTTRRLNAVRFALGPGETPAGVAAGAEGFLAVTLNAGAAWRSIETGTSVDLNGVALSQGFSRIVVVGDAGTVLRSSDDGNTFTLSSIDGAGALTAVAMTGNGARTLTVDDGGRVWESVDRGASFDQIFAPGGLLTSVALSHDGTWALVAGDGGRVFSSSEQQAWMTAKPDVEGLLHAVMITHDGVRGYAAGERGALWRTADHSATWDQADSGTTRTLRALEDLDPH